jgi:hypothetical protein
VDLGWVFGALMLGVPMLYPIAVVFGMDQLKDPDHHFWVMAVGIALWVFFIGIILVACFKDWLDSLDGPSK